MSTETLEIYRKALNFNVIARYDPKIKQLLFHTPHATVYKWGDDKWNKLEYQGVLAIYLRDVSDKDVVLPELSSYDDTVTGQQSESHIPNVLTGQDIYNYGLIIMNRINPDNFSLAIAPNSVLNKRRLFDPDNEEVLDPMKVEVRDDLVMIKTLKKEVYGIWVHTPEDRQNIYELIKYMLESEPKDSFT